MRPFKEQWASLPASRRSSAKIASLCVLIAGAWIAGSATKPEAPLIPGYFLCAAGTGQPTAFVPNVVRASPDKGNDLVQWTLTLKDGSKLLFIQSPGELCKTRPVIPVPNAHGSFTQKEAAPAKPQFTL